jgi:hypothetical protein
LYTCTVSSTPLSDTISGPVKTLLSYRIIAASDDSDHFHLAIRFIFLYIDSYDSIRHRRRRRQSRSSLHPTRNSSQPSGHQPRPKRVRPMEANRFLSWRLSLTISWLLFTYRTHFQEIESAGGGPSETENLSI